MGGLSDVLFGSGGELQTQSLSTMTPEQQALMRTLIQQLGGVGGGGGGASGFAPTGKGGRQALLDSVAAKNSVNGGPPLPNGNMDIAGGNFLADAENTSLAGLEERAMLRATGGLENESDKALLELIKGRGQPGDTTDFFDTNIRDPALRDFEQNIQPNISRKFGGSSFFSSERQKADADASHDLISSLTQARSKLAFDERTAASDRLLRAIGLAPQVDATRTDTRVKELEAMGTERRARNDRITQLLQLLNTGAVENLGGMTGGKTGLVQAFLGGGGGAALGGLIASDPRVKRNIRKIGVTPGGINIYSFTYIGERGRQIGVMADEVEELIPGAVTTIRGVKYVDYNQVI